MKIAGVSNEEARVSGLRRRRTRVADPGWLVENDGQRVC